jgi:hypothetical protein
LYAYGVGRLLENLKERDAAHVWTAPLVKGFLEAWERLGCGHVFGL